MINKNGSNKNIFEGAKVTALSPTNNDSKEKNALITW